MADATFDVAVIGAGMLGAATAYRLARAGRRVVVLEAEQAAQGATGNSFAWLNAVSKEPEPYHRLNAAGMAEYGALGAELRRATVDRSGCIEWAADAAGTSALMAKVVRLQERGYAARMIAGAEARKLEPALRIRPDARVALYEDDAWVDAPAATAALLTGARMLGGEVREAVRVTGFATAGRRVTAIDTSATRVAADAVAICAGVDTPALSGLLGSPIPVERRPGLLAVTTPVPPGTLSRVVYAPELHVRPDVTGGLRLGADDTDELVRDGASPAQSSTACRILLERAVELFGLSLPADVRVAGAYLGVRPVPADGYTVAGRLPGWDNAYVAVTHSGITLGPLLGRLLAAEITTGTHDPLLAPFRPERFTAVR